MTAVRAVPYATQVARDYAAILRDHPDADVETLIQQALWEVLGTAASACEEEAFEAPARSDAFLGAAETIRGLYLPEDERGVA